MEHMEIIGKTFAFVYAKEAYKIEILSEDRVQWTRTEGENAGAGDTETYIYNRLHESIGLITWIEADGLGLSNVLDFGNQTVTTHANLGRQVFQNPGSLKIL